MITSLLLATSLLTSGSSLNTIKSSYNIIYSNKENTTYFQKHTDSSFLKTSNELNSIENKDLIDEPKQFFNIINPPITLPPIDIKPDPWQKDDDNLSDYFSTIYDKTIETKNISKKDAYSALKITYNNVKIKDRVVNSTNKSESTDVFCFEVPNYKSKIKILLFELEENTNVDFRVYSESYKLLFEANNKGKNDCFGTTLNQGIYYIEVFAPNDSKAGNYSLGFYNGQINFKEKIYTYDDKFKDQYKAVVWKNSFIPYNASLDDNNRLMYVKKPAGRIKTGYELKSTTFDYNDLYRIIYIWDKNTMLNLQTSIQDILTEYFDKPIEIDFKDLRSELIVDIYSNVIETIISYINPNIAKPVSFYGGLLNTIIEFDNEYKEKDAQRQKALFHGYLLALQQALNTAINLNHGIVIPEFIKFNQIDKMVDKPLTFGKEKHTYYYLNLHSFYSRYDKSFDFAYYDDMSLNKFKLSNLITYNNKNYYGDIELVSRNDNLDLKLYGDYLNEK